MYFYMCHILKSNYNTLNLSNYVGQKTSQVLKLGRPGNCKCLFGIIVGRLYRMVYATV